MSVLVFVSRLFIDGHQGNPFHPPTGKCNDPCFTSRCSEPVFIAPVLLQILSGAVTAASLLPAGGVYELPPNKVIELSMPALAIGGPVSQAHSRQVRFTQQIFT